MSAMLSAEVICKLPEPVMHGPAKKATLFMVRNISALLGCVTRRWKDRFTFPVSDDSGRMLPGNVLTCRSRIP